MASRTEAPPVIDRATGRRLKIGDVYGAIRPNKAPNELGSSDRHIFLGLRDVTEEDLHEITGRGFTVGAFGIHSLFFKSQEVWDDGRLGRIGEWPVTEAHYHLFWPGWFLTRVIVL